MSARATGGVVCIAAWFAAVVLYAGALGTGAGLSLDRRIRYTDVIADWRLSERVSDAFEQVSLGVLAGTTVVLLVVAAIASGVRGVVFALAAVGGAGAAVIGLERLLGSWDPTGGEAVRETAGAFPSGHAAYAMALALALVTLLPGWWRSVAALASVLLVVSLSGVVLLLGWHYPSDVLGALLVVTGWMGLIQVVGLGVGERDPVNVRRVSSAVLLAVAVLCAGGALSIALLADEGVARFVYVYAGFVASVLLVCVTAAACIWLLASGPSRTPPGLNRVASLPGPAARGSVRGVPARRDN